MEREKGRRQEVEKWSGRRLAMTRLGLGWIGKRWWKAERKKVASDKVGMEREIEEGCR